MAQSMAEPTQPISLGEKTRRSIWWIFLNLFSKREPELPTTVQSEKPKQPFPPIQERPTEPENAGFFTPAEDGSTIAMKIEDQPKEAKRVTFIFQTQAMVGGYGTIENVRANISKAKPGPTVGIKIDEYALLITTSTRDKRTKEVMPGKDSKEPLSIRKAEKPFLITQKGTKTLFLIGASDAVDIKFSGRGAASIGELSADIWAGVNDNGELEYFLRVHEPSWCYDEATQRCLKENESMPLVLGQTNIFWVGRVGVGDDLKPAFSINIYIQEQ